MRKAYLFSFLTIIFLIVFFIFGLQAIAKFTEIFVGSKKGTIGISKLDTTPPAPPQIEILPEFTNKQNLELKIISEPEISISLSLNAESFELKTDKEGRLSYSFKLVEGKNSLSAKAKDTSGNEGHASKTYEIIFDKTPPLLEIISPQEGTKFYGAKQRKTTLKGKTEPGVFLTINERFVIVSEDGAFDFDIFLTEGENVFNFKSKDRPGNITEKNLTLNFSP